MNRKKKKEKKRAGWCPSRLVDQGRKDEKSVGVNSGGLHTVGGTVTDPANHQRINETKHQ